MSVKPKIIVHIEGGLVQSVLASREIDLIIYDYDTDGAEEEDLKLVPQTDGGDEEAYVYIGEYVQVDPQRVNELFKALKDGD